MSYQIVVCAGIAPDPLQRLEPQNNGPALKNEMMLPAVLDPWAANALYEAAELAKRQSGSTVHLISIGPKAKLQQVLMVIAQKVPFELIAVDAPAGGFSESAAVAKLLAEAIQGIANFDRNKLLLFGGWESATRGTGTTMQIVGELLGVIDQFQGVDRLEVQADGSLKVWERVEGGQHQVSTCLGAPCVVGWATGELAEPPNNPQIGMQNMRTVMPSLQRAKTAALSSEGVSFRSVTLPSQQRETRVVKDTPVEAIAREIAIWIRGS